MEHGNMQGMAGMQGMDHSQMKGMQNMDHSKMQGMDHSKMLEMTSQPQSKEALEKEMKQTSDEMKKVSDQLKKKSDAAKPADKSQRQSSPSPQPDHGQMQHQGMSPAPSDHPQSKMVYTCVMHPEVKSDKPGNCSKCGMKLVKKSAAQ